MIRHYLPISILVAAAFAALLYWRHLAPIQRLVRVGGEWATAIVPRFLALTTFLAGSILLFSGATPAVGGRLFWLHRVLPLPVVEVAHFFGSIVGVALLILARGIQRRLDIAYHVTIALLAGGILFSLLKAFDYEEAIFLGVMLALLLPNRRYFYRRASIVEERLTPAWILAIGLVVMGSVVLGYLSYRGRMTPGEMFWEFAFDASAPRFLRATVGVLVFLVLFATARLLRPARPAPPRATRDDLARASEIAGTVPEACAQLVTLGDKSLHFNAGRDGFVMYGVSGRSWVSMGDPVAPVEQWPDLAATFIDMAVRQGGWPVFYKIGRAQLALYLDFGLSVVKLGEEGRVRLADFSLEGPQRRNLRRVWRKAVDDGCSFEVVEPSAVDPLLRRLREISNEWLATKHTREKAFSLGAFTVDYARRHPVGLVRRNGEIVAFANVWQSGEHEELEVDLMRFANDAPPGIMRYLLTEFMIWGRDRGYRWFNLGMAPLSGLRKTLLTPVWNQIGLALYGRGERFYNFQGIRGFKEWFYPEWQSRYLASPGGAARPIAIANIAALIAGGYEGVIRR